MRIVAGLCAVLLLVAGCGQQPGRQGPGAPSSPPPTTSSSVAPEPAQRTLVGKVEEGVEAGCMVLSTEDGMYLLFGETARLAPGDEVEVTGRIGTDVASFCQQGTPFVVENVRPR